MKNAKIYSEKLRHNYKVLQQKEDLLIKLQSTNKIIEQNKAEIFGTPPRKKRKTTEGNIDNHNISTKSCFVNEGLLEIRCLFFDIIFVV